MLCYAKGDDGILFIAHILCNSNKQSREHNATDVLRLYK